MKNKREDLKRDIPDHPNQKVSFSVGITPSVNHMYIAKTRTLTKTAEKYVAETQQACLYSLKKVHWKKDNQNVWYYMDLVFWMPDLRVRDSHNCIKLLMDSLEGLFNSNDYFIMPRIQHVGYDKENPRIDITVRPQLEVDVDDAIHSRN